jgi:hypothetical protein
MQSAGVCVAPRGGVAAARTLAVASRSICMLWPCCSSLSTYHLDNTHTMGALAQGATAAGLPGRAARAHPQ